MNFEELKQCWERLVEAQERSKRLARHGTGSSSEEAGMELFEARNCYTSSYECASSDVKQQMDDHIKLVASQAA